MASRADFPYSIGNGWAPPGGANPVTMTTVQDTNGPKYVARFAQGAINDYHCCFAVPSNYLAGSNITVRVRWRTPATTGNVSWSLLYKAYATNTDLTAAALSTSQITAVSGAANTIQETSFTIPSSDLAADRCLPFLLRRQTTSDTVANYIEVIDIWFEIQTSPVVSTLYAYVPPFACRIAPSSSASYTSAAMTGTPITVPGIYLPKNLSVQPSFDFIIEVPEQYNSNVVPQFVAWVRADGANFSSIYFRLDAASYTDGNDNDPALTTGSDVYLSPSSGRIHSVAFNLPITPAAESLVNIRITRLSLTDGSNAVHGTFVGGMMSFAVVRRNPAIISLDPASGAEPLVNALVIDQKNDTNHTKALVSNTKGYDQYLTYLARATTLFASGGQLEIWWRSTSASGDITFRADYASPAAGDASDVAFTTGTPVTATTSGANKINLTTLEVSSGIVQGDQILIKLYVLGASSTLTSDVQITKMKFRHNITPP